MKDSDDEDRLDRLPADHPVEPPAHRFELLMKGSNDENCLRGPIPDENPTALSPEITPARQSRSVRANTKKLKAKRDTFTSTRDS